MTEIKFRGKTANGQWFYGSLVYSDNIEHAIYFEVGKGSVKTFDFVYVRPETVCRFIERHDNNGKEAYEGDIVFVGNSWNENAVVIYDKDISAFVAQFKKWGNKRISKNTDFEIIGNIHDNPELLL